MIRRSCHRQGIDNLCSCAAPDAAVCTKDESCWSSHTCQLCSTQVCSPTALSSPVSISVHAQLLAHCLQDLQGFLTQAGHACESCCASNVCPNRCVVLLHQKRCPLSITQGLASCKRLIHMLSSVPAAHECCTARMEVNTEGCLGCSVVPKFCSCKCTAS